MSEFGQPPLSPVLEVAKSGPCMASIIPQTCAEMCDRHAAYRENTGNEPFARRKTSVDPVAAQRSHCHFAAVGMAEDGMWVSFRVDGGAGEMVLNGPPYPLHRQQNALPCCWMRRPSPPQEACLAGNHHRGRPVQFFGKPMCRTEMPGAAGRVATRFARRAGQVVVGLM
jgi:hypothetical protein